MYLPNELIVAILEGLDRSNLKSARLVSKTWCSCASGFLFDEIYVAPNKVDLEVFDAVTQHPVLSKCVRRLVYDGSEFVPDLTKTRYMRNLCSQTSLSFPTPKHLPINPDPQINDWVYNVVSSELSLSVAVTICHDHSFINKGYQVYQEHSVYQQRALLSGDFVDSLVQGLSRLVNLKSVALLEEWPSYVRKNLGKHQYGTPLARRWNELHLCPHGWSWEPEGSDFEDLPDGMRHYWIITSALVRAQRHIDEFAIGEDFEYGISPEIFERKDPMRPNALGLDIAALSDLKRLHLRLAGCEDGRGPEYCDNIEGLPKLLGSMHSLRSLSLHLSYSHEDPVCLYKYEQVFPHAMMWDNLEDMALDSFASTATDLLYLFLIQMPYLKHLKLGGMQLLEGNWKSVIECLKQFNQFTTFEIVYDSPLYDFDETVLECENLEIGEYVMKGGRHPCLSDDQPTSFSEAYMVNIDSSLRDRLQRGKSPQ